MKKWMVLCLCLVGLLSACGQNREPAAEDFTVPDGMVSMPCRVMEMENTRMVLAELEGSTAGVYTAVLGDAVVKYEDPARTEVKAGDLVEVIFRGDIMETYPAQLGDISQLWVRGEGFDDRHVRYLELFEEFVREDPALADDITQCGLDLSRTALTPAEQSAVAWMLEPKLGVPVMNATWEELAQQGYINREELYWEDGVFFSVTEKDSSAASLTFDAQMWRSGLGAQYFCDCTSSRTANGPWSEVTVGAVAVS